MFSTQMEMYENEEQRQQTLQCYARHESSARHILSVASFILFNNCTVLSVYSDHCP